MTKLYDRPFINTASETIPAFGVLEIGGWVDDAGGLSVFRAIKPTKDGKLHLINGPTPVPVGRKGWAARAHGVWALYEADQAPTINQEFGPKAGSWALHADGKGGFIIVDDPRGTAAPPPGSPPGSSTKRIRVVEQTKGKVINRIQGTVASTVSETTPQFLINKIFVLSGVDPRPEPVNQFQTVVVQNNLQKAYTNGVDRVTATQNETDQKWYVETATAESSSVIYCEATENKGYQTPKCLAKPVTIAGAIDSAADPFYLVDELSAYYIRKAEGDENGYRLHAVRFTEDYAEGIPGYRIISGEGPALLLLVELVEDRAAEATHCNILTDPAVFGLAFRGRRPVAESSGFDVSVWDPQDLAADAKGGDKWIATWDETNERYMFLLPIPPVTSCILRRFRATSTIAAATGLPRTTWGIGVAQLYDDDGLPDGVPKQIANPFKDGFPNSSGGWVDISKVTPVIVSVGCTLS